MTLSRFKSTIATMSLALGASIGLGQADVITGALTGSTSGGAGLQAYGTGSGANEVYAAYAIGTTSCNIGTVPLNWIASGSDRHPLIIGNVYRIDNGAIEHIGVSWVKHGFCALQQGICGSCTPTCGGCCSTLGVGCSDPYSAGLNGTQSGLGPRFEINSTTGEYPWPFTTSGQSGATNFKRLNIHVDDINPLLNPNADYVAEAQYVAKDDADAGNSHNNASHRMVRVGNENTFGGGWYLNYVGNTVREEPAIFAWEDAYPNVQLVAIDVPGDGRYWVGSNVTDNGDGTWHYEYAVMNFDSNRNAGSFSVQSGATPSNVGFRDVEYFGEPFNQDDWGNAFAGGEVTWDNGTTFGSNPLANAIRWSTIYNFRFDAPAAPVDGTVTLGLFAPDAGNPDEMTATLQVPGQGQAGCNEADIAEPFDVLDLGDLQAFIAAFTTGDLAADIAAPFGVLDLADVQAFIAAFTAGCP